MVGAEAGVRQDAFQAQRHWPRSQYFNHRGHDKTVGAILGGLYWTLVQSTRSALPRNLPMMKEPAPLLFAEATTADGLWTLAVRSSDGVVGHIFRVNGDYAYFAGRFNALNVTFRDPSLERLKERIVASSR